MEIGPDGNQVGRRADHLHDCGDFSDILLARVVELEFTEGILVPIQCGLSQLKRDVVNAGTDR